MSKPMVITLPFVLLLLDYWPLQRVAGVHASNYGPPTIRFTWPALVVEKLPLSGLAVAPGAVTLCAQKEAIAPLPLSLRLANAPVSCVTYLQQMFYPAGLAAYYPHPEAGLPSWKILGAILLLLAIATSTTPPT